MNLNKAILIGRLTKDPEVKTTPSGRAVANISIATSTTWKDATGNKKEKTEFHDVVLWGKVAEIAGQYLIKGQEVYIEGRIETRNWEGKDGIKRYKTEIIISGPDGKLLMGNKPKNQNYSPSNPSSFTKQANNATTNNETEEEIRIEDIPF